MFFRYFLIISPWKRAGPFIWISLNPLYPRMLCAKFGWNWPSGSGEEDFKTSSKCFHSFVTISPWKRTGPFIWQTWIPFTQGWFVPISVKIRPVVLEKKKNMWKVSDNVNGDDNADDNDVDGQRTNCIRKALEPSAQVSLKACYCSWFYNLLNALTTGWETYVWPGGPDTMKGNPHGLLIEHWIMSGIAASVNEGVLLLI